MSGRLSIPTLFAMVVAFIGVAMGCSGFDTTRSAEEAADSYIELDVEPETARVFVDDEYMGRADGWSHQMIPVDPGHRRLKIDAEGYLAQRLDVEVDRGRTVTVRARLEQDIQTPDGEQLDTEDPQLEQTPDDEEDGITPPDHPAAPE